MTRNLRDVPAPSVAALRAVSHRLESLLQAQGDRVESLPLADGGCRVSLDRESESPDVLLVVHVRPEGLLVQVQVEGELAANMEPPRGLPWSRLVPLMLGLAGWDYRPPN